MVLRFFKSLLCGVYLLTGALEVSRRSPFACWFSAMLYCFGGAVLSGVIMAQAPIEPLANSTNILLASLMWSVHQSHNTPYLKQGVNSLCFYRKMIHSG